MPDQKVYTVAEITKEIKFLLETTLPTIWVEGEVSNFKPHYSGHFYFTIKDDQAQLPCVMWRSRTQMIPFSIQDGMKVLVQGNITLYEKSGRYQLDITQIQPAGIGALQLAFEQMKQKLKTEGLFDEEHKKPIPPYPERIGIVTSPTGAAVRDLVSVIHRRFPGVELILRPVKVQGEGAAHDIAGAIREFNQFGKVDVLIVGRGGGSLEDLWAFNEETVARAIFESKIPVISAVGHEIDFTIADFVADVRAATPSAAAELVVRDQQEILNYLNTALHRMQQGLLDRVEYLREKVQSLAGSYAFRRPLDLIKQFSQRLDEMTKNLETGIRHQLELLIRKVDSTSKHLDALNPLSILQRGYSITMSGGKILRDAAGVSTNDPIEVRLHKGSIKGKVTEIIPNPE